MQCFYLGKSNGNNNYYNNGNYNYLVIVTVIGMAYNNEDAHENMGAAIVDWSKSFPLCSSHLS